MNPSRLRISLLVSAAVAVVLALALTVAASGATQNIGPYTVTDTVTYDTVANTTTVTYDVVAPAGAKDISHLNVQICSPDIQATINGGGKIQDGDPSTGQTGPIIKWDDQQNAGTTETYSYTVDGLVQTTGVTLQIKNDTVYSGTVQGLGCQPARGTLIIDKVTDPAGDPQSFDFSAPGVGAADQSFSLADQSAPKVIDVAPGAYDVTEAQTAGWDFNDVTCDDANSAQSADRQVTANVEPGETVTCTFRNTKQAAPTPPGEQQVGGEQVTPPGEQEVLGETVEPGTARIAGASGCQRKPFKISVRGRNISKVAFSIDGKRVKKVRSSGNGRVYSITINPNKFKPGAHRVKAKVTFTAASNTPSKTLRARFARCVRQVAPTFTG
jgi:hypothetical protein